MWRDPIVEEVRKVREEYARRFKFDLAAIVRDLQARQKASGTTVVDRSRKPAARPTVGSENAATKPHCAAPKRNRRAPTRKLGR